MSDLVTPATPTTGSPRPGPTCAGPGAGKTTAQRERPAAWLQLPRRILLWLAAFAAALLVTRSLRVPLLNSPDLGPRVVLPGPIRAYSDWSISWLYQRPVADLIADALPATLALLGAALVLAVVGTVALVAASALARRLGAGAGLPGRALGGAARLLLATGAALPPFALAMLVVLVLAPHLGALYTQERLAPLDLATRAALLLLPALVLAIGPAGATGLLVAREVWRAESAPGSGRLLAWLCRALGTVLAQAGGLLSGALLVEFVFARRGVGGLVFRPLLGWDHPLLLGALAAVAGVALVGRLGAELFHWLERLLRGAASDGEPAPAPAVKAGRRRRMALALAALLLPAGLAAAGLAVPEGAAHRVSFEASNSSPTPSHPWGADKLGRDLQARVLRGTLTTLTAAGLATAIVFLPGLLGAAAVAALRRRGGLGPETAADLLLLPADALALLPVVPAAAVAALLVGRDAGLYPAAVVVLLPRALRAYRASWEARRPSVASAGALFLATLSAAFGVVTALEFLGVGPLPPTPSLEGMLGDVVREMLIVPHTAVAPGVVLFACAWGLYLGAHGLAAEVGGEEALAGLGE